VVLHTNWYWRNLVRIFRFSDSAFYRIQPTGKAIRATHEYASVFKLIVERPRTEPPPQYVVDSNDDAHKHAVMVIYYNDGCTPDWITSSVTSVSRMVKILCERNPSIVLVDMDSVVN